MNGLDRMNTSVASLAKTVGLKVKEVDIRVDFKEYQDKVNKEVKDLTDSLNDVQKEIDDAFADGIIDVAEAASIEKYLNQLAVEKGDVDAKYNTIYMNSKLRGVAKTNLRDAYADFVIKYDLLVLTINTAIADGKATPQEKIEVDKAFDAYRLSIEVLSKRFEEALADIQKNTIADLEIGGRNLLLKSNVKLIKASGTSIYNFGKYIASKQIINGKKYTLVWAGKTNSPQGINAYVGSTTNIDSIKSTTTVIQSKVFTATVTADNISFYQLPNDATATPFASEVEWACLYEGDVKAPLTWTPAPEDVDIAIADAKKASEAYTNSKTLAVKAEAEAYTDGVVTNSEAKMIVDLNKKSLEDKAYADGLSRSLTTSLGQLEIDTNTKFTSVDTQLNKLQTEINNIEVDVDLTPVEKENLKMQQDSFTMQYWQLGFQLDTMLKDIFIPAANKTVLTNDQTDLNSKYGVLNKAINDALLDGKISQAEKDAINLAITNFKTSASKTNTDCLTAYQEIVKAKDASVTTKVNNAKTELNASITGVNNSVTTLRNDMNTSFADGILTDAEVQVIKGQLNSLKVEKANLDGKYDVVYANVLLAGTAKTGLLNAKNDLNAKYTALVNAINVVINVVSPSKPTPAQIQAVDTGFTNYSTSVLAFSKAAETATKSIEDVINGKASSAETKAAAAQSLAEDASKVTSFLSPNANGQVFATGLLYVGSVDQGNAGVNGATTDPTNGTDVRFWAGSDYANHKTAPFRVLNNGSIYATKGEIGNFDISDKGLVKEKDDKSRFLMDSDLELISLVSSTKPLVPLKDNPGQNFPKESYHIAEIGVKPLAREIDYGTDYARSLGVFKGYSTSDYNPINSALEVANISFEGNWDNKVPYCEPTANKDTLNNVLKGGSFGTAISVLAGDIVASEYCSKSLQENPPLPIVVDLPRIIGFGKEIQHMYLKNNDPAQTNQFKQIMSDADLVDVYEFTKRSGSVAFYEIPANSTIHTDTTTSRFKLKSRESNADGYNVTYYFDNKLNVDYSIDSDFTITSDGKTVNQTFSLTINKGFSKMDFFVFNNRLIATVTKLEAIQY